MHLIYSKNIIIKYIQDNLEILIIEINYIQILIIRI